jgi:hypothetical protein
MQLFKGNPHAKASIENALAKDHAKTADDSFIEIHKRLRDGDLATAENAREFINSIFDEDRYDISRSADSVSTSVLASRWMRKILSAERSILMMLHYRQSYY